MNVAKEIFAELEIIFEKHKISSFDNFFDDAMTEEIENLKKKYVVE